MKRVELGPGLLLVTLPTSEVNHGILHYGLHDYRTAANE